MTHTQCIMETLEWKVLARHVRRRCERRRRALMNARRSVHWPRCSSPPPPSLLTPCLFLTLSPPPPTFLLSSPNPHFSSDHLSAWLETLVYYHIIRVFIITPPLFIWSRQFRTQDFGCRCSNPSQTYPDSHRLMYVLQLRFQPLSKIEWNWWYGGKGEVEIKEKPMSPEGEFPAVHLMQIASDQSSRRESRKQMSQFCNRSNQMGSQADAAYCIEKGWMGSHKIQ